MSYKEERKALSEIKKTKRSIELYQWHLANLEAELITIKGARLLNLEEGK